MRQGEIARAFYPAFAPVAQIYTTGVRDDSFAWPFPPADRQKAVIRHCPAAAEDRN